MQHNLIIFFEVHTYREMFKTRWLQTHYLPLIHKEICLHTFILITYSY